MISASERACRATAFTRSSSVMFGGIAVLSVLERSQVGCQAARRGCDGPGARASSIFRGTAAGAPSLPLKELAAACLGCELGFAEPPPVRDRDRMCSGNCPGRRSVGFSLPLCDSPDRLTHCHRVARIARAGHRGNGSERAARLSARAEAHPCCFSRLLVYAPVKPHVT